MSTEQTAPPYTQLAQQIAAAQSGNRFARCTVVVPHRAVAYDVMRHLGKSSRGGTINVRTVTLLDLARELVDETGALAEREPLTAAALRTAIEHELRTEPLGFAEVADQPATLEALTSASTRLLRRARTPRSGLPPITADLLAIHERALGTLAATYTAQDVFAAARARLEDPAARARLGQVTLFQLPTQHDPQAAAFVAVLRRQAAEISLSGYDGCTVRESIDELVSVTDPVEEVRFAVESVARALADGAVDAGNRIGIFFPNPDPYLGLLSAQLKAAGIAYTAPGSTPVTALAPARALLRLLDLEADDTLDLRAILDAHWEGSLERQLPSLPELPSSRTLEQAFVYGSDVDAQERGSALHEENWQTLLAYREAFASRLRRIDEASTWAEAVASVRELYDEVIHHSAATPASRACHAAIGDAIDTLAALGDEQARPDRETLTALLASELGGRSFREGRLSVGVTVGTHPSAVGRDLDLVILLGMADGIAPAPSSIDALLPDEVCEQLGGALLTARQSRRDQRDQFAAAVAAGRRVLVTAPRGRLRTPGPLTLSSWIAPAQHEVDTRLLAEFPGLEHLRSVTRLLPSPLHAARNGYSERTVPTTAARGWEHAMLAASDTGPEDAATAAGPCDRLPAAARLAREIRASRRDGTFTRFTGNLTGIAAQLAANGNGFGVLNPHDAASDNLLHVSATSLEAWARDPFTYFLEQVLRVELFAYPDEEEQADPLVFGNIVHRALEEIVLAHIAGGRFPDQETIDAVHEKVFAYFAKEHWSPALWEVQQRSVRAMVERALVELRAGLTTDGGLTFEPVGAESGFGRNDDSSPALRVTIDDGFLLLRGAVDRVDRLSDGTLRVIDYKTGSHRSYQGINEEDPLLGSTRLQLPLYALHALACFQDVPVDDVLDLPEDEAPQVEYHFLREDPVARIGYRWSPRLHSLFVQALRRITSLIAAGVFPPLVEEPAAFGGSWENWHTVMGQREQWRMHERMRAAGHLGMLEDTADDEEPSDD